MAENTKQTNRERLREITAGIEQGIKELFESDRYMQYLRVMSRFHHYSVNNQMLINLQKPNATHVAGFNKWRDQFERHVKQGERGIKIIAPTPFKKRIEEQKLDPDTRLPVLDREGKVVMEEKEVEIPMFRPVTVFDVSQTDGKPLPHLAADLHGNVQQYEVFVEALSRSSPVPMEFEKIADGADGYFSEQQQRIAIREGMSEVQTISAAVHEIAHSKLHNYEKERQEAAKGDETKEPPKPKDRRTEEVEAESVSYAVCQYYGIETGENSFGYIAGWSKGKELPELRASLETINKTASRLINDVDRHFAEICKERGIDLTAAGQDMEKSPSAAELAAEMDEFMFHFDTYEYRDTTADRAEAVAKLTADIETGNIQHVGDYLRTIMKDSDSPETVREVETLLDRLEAQVPTAIKENLYLLDDTVYLHLQDSSDGYDYTLYDKDTMRELDGGQIDRLDVPRSTACLEICGEHNLGTASIKYAPLSMIETLQETERKAAQVEAAALGFVQEAISEAGLSDTVFITGIQCYEALDADPQKPEHDVLVGYVGDIREDDFFSLLHSQEYVIDGLPVDINPITPEKSGTIRAYQEQLKEQKAAEPETAPKLEKAQEPDQSTEPEPPLEPEQPTEAGLSPKPEPEPASLLSEPKEQSLDEYPMPDPELTVEDLERCGYLDGDMLPLSKNRALELLEKDFTVYSVLVGGEASMAFDREDIEAHNGIFAIPREEWGTCDEFKNQLDNRLNRQEERENAFLSHKSDCYANYQLRDGDDLHFVRSQSLDQLRAERGDVLKENYNLIYTAPLAPQADTEECLNRLIYQFNMEHPDDFRGRSLSISDIVALKQGDKLSCYYVDSGCGFTELPGFFSGKNMLRAAEDAIEQNDNQLDGIINNTPGPSVAELEAQVKAGRQISLLDLASAVHREQGEKKKSVMERLKEQQPQQERKKATPKRSAEREI